jgi:succinylglutamic semialdehyde dehydrogenase
MESGKPLWESNGEVTTAISKVANSIEAIEARRWESSDTTSRNAIRFRPLGCMLVLGPYNLPLHLPGAHIVPSLLAGNTVLFKPSEKSPAVGEWIQRAWEQAGLPAGVLTLFHGSVEQAKHAVSLASLSGVLFTGSHGAGVQIHRQLAGRPECMLALEMGGNNAMIVDQISDRRAAMIAIIQSAYITSGQRCTCARRLIVVDSPENRGFIHELADAIKRIQVDSPIASPQPYMGALVSDSAAQSILDAQSHLRTLGCQSLLESKRMRGHPAILTPGLMFAGADVSENLAKLDQENFGPLLVASMAQDIDHAIEKANQTSYGLSAGILSDSRDSYDRFVSRVKAGIINWNTATTGATGRLPFGGVGASGNHRPSGFYAADYCSDPVASIENPVIELPPKMPPGLEGL